MFCLAVIPIQCQSSGFVTLVYRSQVGRNVVDTVAPIGFGMRVLFLFLLCIALVSWLV